MVAPGGGRFKDAEREEGLEWLGDGAAELVELVFGEQGRCQMSRGGRRTAEERSDGGQPALSLSNIFLIHLIGRLRAASCLSLASPERLRVERAPRRPSDGHAVSNFRHLMDPHVRVQEQRRARC